MQYSNEFSGKHSDTIYMTHLQQLFINNIRYYRSVAGYSQVAFSEQLGLSPNYLNAVENGKNFPSPEVLQRILDVLNLLPYELFLEKPTSQTQAKNNETAQIVEDLKQQIIERFDSVLQKC